LENVRVGQTCRVTIDAIPNQIFGGEVVFLAAVADSGSWMSNPNQRLYKTEISIWDGVPAMRPGMSCNIEILIDHLEDVLYVPRQAVHLDGARTICFVMNGGGPEVRVVRVGQDNVKWVSVLAGLEEGEVVTLSPPPSWEPAPAASPVPEHGPRGGPGEDARGQADRRGERNERERSADGDAPAEGDAHQRPGRMEDLTEEQREAMRQRYRESQDQ
jgi:hypothetical protein